MGGDDPIKQVEHYAHALKAPRIRQSAARLADQARDAGWSHEEYLAAVLSREVSARESSGAQTRIRSAGFPARKSLEEFNFDHQPALSRETIAHLGTGTFLAQGHNVVLLGPPGTGKTHCETCVGCSPVWAECRGSASIRSDVRSWLTATRLACHLPVATVCSTSLAGSALAGAGDPKDTLATRRKWVCLGVGYVAAPVGAGPAHLPLA
ncbi:hypothetical protein GCM10023094_00610 [Rhodococcus olei]|uniref:IstB-like ATP-binding domain-containing protein n=1 Tax=Rhodococcus olei TaxID=2161675 RepID=A0ABP8NSZ3_9NOCA